MLSKQFFQTRPPAVKNDDAVGMPMDDEGSSDSDDSDYYSDYSDYSDDSDDSDYAGMLGGARLLADTQEFAFKNKMERCDSAPLLNMPASMLARMAKSSPDIRAILLDGPTNDEPELRERCDSAPLLSMTDSMLARMARPSLLLEDRWTAKPQ